MKKCRALNVESQGNEMANLAILKMAAVAYGGSQHLSENISSRESEKRRNPAGLNNNQ